MCLLVFSPKCPKGSEDLHYPEFLWLIIEKLGDLFKEGTWSRVFSELSQYQQQLRTLLWYGLLTRKENER